MLKARLENTSCNATLGCQMRSFRVSARQLKFPTNSHRTLLNEYRSSLDQIGNKKRVEYIQRAPARSRRARALRSPRALCSSHPTPRLSRSRRHLRSGRSCVGRGAPVHSSRRAAATRPQCCTRRAPAAGSRSRPAYKRFVSRHKGSVSVGECFQLLASIINRAHTLRSRCTRQLVQVCGCAPEDEKRYDACTFVFRLLSDKESRQSPEWSCSYFGWYRSSFDKTPVLCRWPPTYSRLVEHFM